MQGYTRRSLLQFAGAGMFLVLSGAMPAQQPAGESLDVLPERLDGVDKSQMVLRFLQMVATEKHKTWEREYESRTSADTISAYQREKKQLLLDLIGGLPSRTPLNAKVTGVVYKPWYRVEKVIFESEPGLYVTAALFLPHQGGFRPPYPAVVLACGHKTEGKAALIYQKAAALLAVNGMAGFIFDPVGQGERYQALRPDGSPIPGSATYQHLLLAMGSILVGRNVARYQVWDAMRAIDYLRSRPDIQADRIGMMGNSGGGTQTAYVMALDSRLRAASPNCFVESSYRKYFQRVSGDSEWNLFAQAGVGIDHADYLMMAAPLPILIGAATRDELVDIQAAWESFRAAKRLYSRIGAHERIDLVENDAGHGYFKPLREASVGWMLRWLRGASRTVVEPDDLEVLEPSEIRCTPRGQTLLMQGARSVYDLNIEYAKELAAARARLWRSATPSALRQAIRKITGIRDLAELSSPEVEWGGAIERAACRVRKVVLRPQPGIWLPALLFVPSNSTPGRAVLYLDGRGKHVDAGPGGPIEALSAQGAAVLAVDLRGMGETRQTRYDTPSREFGTDWKDVFGAYRLGLSYVGMRCEDILVSARWLLQQSTTEQKLDMVAIGDAVIPALHATALEPELFRSLELREALPSWDHILHERLRGFPLANLVHGALRIYDLDDLGRLSGLEVRGLRRP